MRNETDVRLEAVCNRVRNDAFAAGSLSEFLHQQHDYISEEMRILILDSYEAIMSDSINFTYEQNAMVQRCIRSIYLMAAMSNL